MEYYKSDKPMEYYEPKTDPMPIKVAESINPWKEGEPAHVIVNMIYEARKKNEGCTLEELAIAVGWRAREDYRVEHIISATRYVVGWMLACDCIPTGRKEYPLKWVYFRATEVKDQERYVLRRIADHERRGYSVSYLLQVSDLTEERINELIEEAKEKAEKSTPFIEIAAPTTEAE